jgi:hypothetical protein
MSQEILRPYAEIHPSIDRLYLISLATLFFQALMRLPVPVYHRNLIAAGKNTSVQFPIASSPTIKEHGIALI